MVSAKVVENVLFKRLRCPCLIVIARRFSAEAMTRTIVSFLKMVEVPGTAPGSEIPISYSL